MKEDELKQLIIFSVTPNGDTISQAKFLAGQRRSKVSVVVQKILIQVPRAYGHFLVFELGLTLVGKNEATLQGMLDAFLPSSFENYEQGSF